jgi:hypothetical protein
LSLLFSAFKIFCCTQTHTWYLEVKYLFFNRVPNALVISATINKLVLEHHSAWSSILVRNPEVWTKPCSPFYKINYDTAIHDSFSAQAAIIRNSYGVVIKCSSLISPPCAAIYGEALAAFLAVQLALSLQISSFILEGVGVLLQLHWLFKIQQSLKNGILLPPSHTFIPSFLMQLASHVNRSTNFYAHHVANWAPTRLHFGCIPILSAISGSSPLCFGNESSSSFLVP